MFLDLTAIGQSVELIISFPQRIRYIILYGQICFFEGTTVVPIHIYGLYSFQVNLKRLSYVLRFLCLARAQYKSRRECANANISLNHSSGLKMGSVGPIPLVAPSHNFLVSQHRFIIHPKNIVCY